MKKDYSGILICTDYDETFTSGGVIPQNNIDAVRAFMEAGGQFTFSSGRGGQGSWLKGIPFTPNAPMVGYSGSEIWDFETKSHLSYLAMPCEMCVDAMNTIGEILPPLQYIEICIGKGLSFDFTGKTREAYQAGVDRITTDVLKVFCVQRAGDGKPHEVPDVIRETFGGRFELTSNVPYSFELTLPGVHKGSGIARLREIVKPRLLVCVGDYLGDIAMLREADIGYAVENAHPDVRAAADRVTVPASRGALAQIIEDLGEYTI